MKKLFFVVALVFTNTLLFAQTTVKGKVTDANTGDPLPGTNITIVGKSLGTTTDFDGNYTLSVNENAPFTIEASSIGYQSVKSEVTASGQTIDFKLQESAEALDEVVVSASRTPERVRESPVTIERIDAKVIQSTSSPSFYDGLENLKGVDINTSSLTFKSLNTRGFATFSNNRFVQLVDGVDNTSPALNFVLGNLIGMNELDVNSVEILPGASSALYGANAFNGILFMTSKDPFKYTGISSYFKTGLTMQEAAGDNAFYDLGIRAAYKFNDKFAAKANFSYLKGTDWWAVDYDMYDSNAVPVGEPAAIYPYENRGPYFDALNIYGDEVATNIHDVAVAMEAGGLLPAGASAAVPNDKVGRTGYKEKDLTDYRASSVKADVALHYKPWGDDKEFVFNYRTGKGNTIYQGGSRYYLKDFIMNQAKLEFRGKNFFLRGYMTTEDAGSSYDMRFAGINMNKVGAAQWFGTYVGAYLQSIGSGYTSAESHARARYYADSNLTPQPGSDDFNTLFKTVVNDPDLKTGAKFVDNSKVHHVDANYNFSEMINEWADLQLGGSYRKYTLNSDGTIFTDYDGSITYSEYGAYMQLSKKFADDRLKFTGSARYDKAQNFKGNVSPRLALVYSAGEKRNHNFRASYQTGFRNPTTQDQYIGLDLGAAILVGSAPDNLDRYTSNPIAISGTSQFLVNTFGAGGLGTDVQLSGRRAYDNAFTLSSVLAGSPKKANVEYVQPERITAYEVGYRGKVSVLNIDLNAYYNQYEGFIATKTVIVPNFGDVDTLTDPASNPADLTNVPGVGPVPNAKLALNNGDYTPFQVYTNSTADISSYGASIGLSTHVNKFDIGLNYTYAKFNFDQATDPDYEAGFNTPEHKVKFSFGSKNIFDNLGFKVNYRYNTEYLWQQTFADAMIPANSVVDAQISYKVPQFKSLFKVGGSNIGGNEYRSAPGVGNIGSQYFVSWTINP